MINLTKKAFLKWMESLPPDKVVGCSRSLCYCPIANWIRSTDEEIIRVLVFSRRVEYSTYERPELVTRRLPKWAVKFVEAVDDLEHEHEVTAAEAVEILYGVEA